MLADVAGSGGKVGRLAPALRLQVLVCAEKIFSHSIRGPKSGPAKSWLSADVRGNLAGLTKYLRGRLLLSVHCTDDTMDIVKRRPAVMPSPMKRREDRLEVRLTPKAKSMLKRAALVERKTVSAFILAKARGGAPARLP